MTALNLPSTTRSIEDQRASNGFRISLALALMVLVVVVYYAFVQPITQLALISMVLAGACVVSAVLCLRKQTSLGIGILAVVVMAATVAQSFITLGYGFSTGVTQIVVLYGIAIFTLPSRSANRVLVAAVLVWIVLSLFDVFAPTSTAILEPFDRWANIGVVVVFVAIFGLLIASRYSTFSLRTKFIVVFIAIAIIAVGGVTVTTSQVVETQLSAGIEENLNSVARVTGLSTIENLEKRIFTLQSFGLNEGLQEAIAVSNASNVSRPSELTRRSQQWQTAAATDPLVQSILAHPLVPGLQQYQTAFPDNINLLVTNQFGALVAATYHPADYVQANEDWWQAAYNNGEGKTFISQPIHDENQTLGLVIAVPVFNADQTEVIGVIQTFVQMEAFAEVLAAGQFGETGKVEIYLPDDTELEITQENGEPELERDPVPTDFLPTLRGERSFLNSVHEGIPTVAGLWALESASADTDAISVLDDLNWRVVALQDRSEAFESVIIAERITLLVAMGVLLLVVTLAIFVAQALSRPIIRLTQTAEKVRSGDLNAMAVADTTDEIGTLATTFNDMTLQLRSVLSGLEDRVADRTRALATSTEVSRRLSNILDQRQLVSEVVQQLHDAFNYYHVQMYIFDTRRENLTMVGGTGEAGQTMLERGHKIARGRGLVGRAAATNTIVLVPDVSKEAAWLPNPLLPETKAEVAVPIAIGDVVAGVLDVQQNAVGGLSLDDAELIQSIANQVAVALQNIRAYASAQREADREALINTINQKIQSTDDIEAALQVAVREIGRALGAPRVRVKLTANGQRTRENV